ncbi:hypothetical protein VTL71DRAFT_318 [Oculimacula yallundae]|uniref:Uncharacterized protein n=1 Tax=Oculimacula yallundae TaxID=86028 RepID=A0ABR4CZV5_9HELO
MSNFASDNASPTETAGLPDSPHPQPIDPLDVDFLSIACFVIIAYFASVRGDGDDHKDGLVALQMAEGYVNRNAMLP